MQPEQPAGAPPPAPPPYDPSVAPQHDYSFILNPEKPAKAPLIPGSSSMLGRALVVLGGILILMIVFVVIKGIVSGGGNLNDFVSLAQDQQAMIHLVQNAEEQQGLPTNTQNFVVTADLSLSTSEKETLRYLKQNHTSVKSKQLGLKVSSSTDTQLTNAASAGTYDQTFHEVMKSKLNSYTAALQQSYQRSKGQKGRQLLNNEYNRAQLLLQQLQAPSS